MENKWPLGLKRDRTEIEDWQTKRRTFTGEVHCECKPLPNETTVDLWRKPLSSIMMMMMVRGCVVKVMEY